MKPPDKDPLLDELIGGEDVAEFRRVSLECGLDALRRHKRRHVLARWAVVGACGAIAALIAVHRAMPPVSPGNSGAGDARAGAVEQPVEPPVRFISDEELLALFPGRAVALIGSPGQQKLVFLDSGSEERSGGL